MNSIFKTRFGTHIDLSHILSISDAYFVDRMGSGGYFVEFQIQFILRDSPIFYTEYAKDILPKTYDGNMSLAYSV